MHTMRILLFGCVIFLGLISAAGAQTAPPVLAPIGAQSVDEGQVLTVNVSASDDDGTVATLSTSALPTGATFIDNGNGSGVLSWTPDFSQAGAYDVTFYAADTVTTDIDSELVSITVNNVNRAPELASIGAQSVNENALLTFGITATDADAQTLTLTTSTLPTGAGFVDNGNGTGTFTWTPTYEQSGSHSVTFYATDGTATDSEVVAITVTNINRDPVLAAIGAQSVNENALLTFGISATDADAQTLTLTTSTLPTGAGFVDNGNGTGTFTWTPTFEQSGGHSVTFYVTDGTATDSEVVAITVTNVNRDPVLAAIGAQSVNENALLTFGITATDADAQTLTLTTSTLPTGAGFVDNGNGTGAFTWTPTYEQSGGHSVTFYATDGTATDSEVVAITVTNINRDPVLAAIGAQSVNENALLTFGISATDADAQTLTLTTSTLPTGAGFVDNGNGTGTFTWTPTFEQSGGHSVTFYVTDGTAIDSEVVAITVTNINRDPVLAAIGAQSVNENALLTFGISATDADAQTLTLTTSTLPTGAGFVDNGDGTGTFTWTPTYEQSGSHSVTFYATDGTATDSEVVAITVTNVNRDPVLAAIGAQSVNENALLTFGITATDADAQTLTLTTSTLPTGAGFVDNGNGTGTFTWTPTYTQAGSFTVTFRVSDGAAVDSEVVAITVTNVNRLPELAAIGARTIDEHATLSFSVTAADPDLEMLTLTTSALPANATFTDNGNGTGAFSFTPSYFQAGAHNVTFYVTDGLDTDSEVVTITVNNVNQLPVLDPIGPLFVTEGANLHRVITAADADLTALTMTVSTLPAHATFTDNGDGTATFDFTPSFTQADIISLRFIVSDGVAADTELVFVTIDEAGNQSPILTAIGNRSVGEGQTLAFTVNATDPEGIAPILTTSALPANATFTPTGNGAANFAFNPDFTQNGSYPITFYATDDSGSVTSELVTITVTEAGNQAPILAAIGAQSVNENAVLAFGVSATDLDSPTLTLTTSTLPANATFTDNGNGTGSFSFAPDFFQAGAYSITFYASDGIAIDSEVVAITVANINRLPVLAAIGNRSVNETASLSFTVTASDPDLTTLILTASPLPENATFTDNGDGTGSFGFTPTYYQAGDYTITFAVTDGEVADSEQVLITVNNVNQLPVLAAIGALFVTEGQNLHLVATATDADGTPLIMTTSALPNNAAFVDNGNGTADLDFNPDYTQAQIISLVFRVTDGVAVDSELVFITITEAGNQPPVLAAIGARSTPEGVNLTFTVTATDLDGTTPVLSAVDLPIGAAFTDNHNGSGSFAWTPTFEQEGSYAVTFIASDGTVADSELVTITVGGINQTPIANAGSNQVNVPAGTLITLDGSGSYDPDGPAISTYTWAQIGGTTVVLSSTSDIQPTFTPTAVDMYVFELTVSDGTALSAPDTVSVTVISGAPPRAITDLSIQIVTDNIRLSWSAVTLDTAGLAATLDRYVIYRGASAWFSPTQADSIGSTDPSTLTFVDNNLGGADVVGDTITNYFYVVQAVDFLGNRSVVSNRVGEYDYPLVTTSTSDYNLVAVPFMNTGIANADGLIDAIGRSNVLTVNNYIPASQSYQSRFAAGFGANFAVVPGGIYQVNAAAATVFSVAGRVPEPGTISYQIITTATTDFNFIMVPFDRAADFSVAQDVINNIPGVLNTLNNFVAGSQNYISRFAAGFGTNFGVKAGKPYQANAAGAGTFPQ